MNACGWKLEGNIYTKENSYQVKVEGLWALFPILVIISPFQFSYYITFSIQRSFIIKGISYPTRCFELQEAHCGEPILKFTVEINGQSG